MKKRFGKYGTSQKRSPSIKDLFFLGYFTITALILIFLPVYFSFGGQIHLPNSIVNFLEKVVFFCSVCGIYLTTRGIFKILFQKQFTKVLVAQDMPLIGFYFSFSLILNETIRNAG